MKTALFRLLGKWCGCCLRFATQGLNILRVFFCRKTSVAIISLFGTVYQQWLTGFLAISRISVSGYTVCTLLPELLINSKPYYFPIALSYILRITSLKPRKAENIIMALCLVSRYFQESTSPAAQLQKDLTTYLQIRNQMFNPVGVSSSSCANLKMSLLVF